MFERMVEATQIIAKNLQPIKASRLLFFLRHQPPGSCSPSDTIVA
jgi:hypothetical protein